MNHLDLFSGIGGFSLAARWIGWETVAQVEWDKWCQKVLAKNFPDALRFGDIVEFNKMLQDGKITTDTNSNRRTNGEVRNSKTEGNERQKQLNINEGGRMGYDIGYIDIITGGFPCQPFSHAGKRKGVADERYLWPEMLRTIRILKPSFVVGENVAGLVSMDNGKTLDAILSDLEDEGYQVESFIIPACAVGAWHRRDRIWIVAHSVNSTDRADRGQGREKETIQSEYREAGLSRESCGTDTEVCGVSADPRLCGLQGMSQARNNGSDREKSLNEQSAGCNRGEQMRNPESNMGMLADGLPLGLVRWDREPEGVPRVATGVKDRVNRLKGLGNAIVPQVAYQIFKAIEAVNNFF